MKYILFLTAVLLLSFMPPPGGGAETPCSPTAPDMEGPFYKPDAPKRRSTGRGLVVEGKVKSASSCAIIPGARIEWWQAGPQGRYDDAHRGTTFTGADGAYRFDTDFPPGYYGRPPHIHFKIFAPGHETLTTQVYPQEGQNSITFDFILLEEGNH